MALRRIGTCLTTLYYLFLKPSPSHNRSSHRFHHANRSIATKPSAASKTGSLFCARAPAMTPAAPGLCCSIAVATSFCCATCCCRLSSFTRQAATRDSERAKVMSAHARCFSESFRRSGRCSPPPCCCCCCWELRTHYHQHRRDIFRYRVMRACSLAGTIRLIASTLLDRDCHGMCLHLSQGQVREIVYYSLDMLRHP